MHADSAAPCLIILTAPSGAGKSSVARGVLRAFPAFHFSVSATTRAPRGQEKEGVHYHFLSEAAFRQLIEDGALAEYEEVYAGVLYGTLRREVEGRGTPVLLDIDVKGATRLKARYGDRALVLFIAPPSLEALATRLQERGTESEDRVRVRLARAREEMTYADRFDACVVNDELDRATAEAVALIRPFVDRGLSTPSPLNHG
ncbi:MAG: guanylate kinase [Bacteroidota bacterium]